MTEWNIFQYIHASEMKRLATVTKFEQKSTMNNSILLHKYILLMVTLETPETDPTSLCAVHV